MLSLLQDWTTISGTGTGGNSETVTQTASAWPSLDEYSNITFWLEVRDVTLSTGGSATLSYQTSPTPDESFFMTLGVVTLAASPTPVVTKIRLGSNPAVALARYVRWSISVQGSSTVWSATFRILFAASAGVEGPTGFPGDTSGFRLTLTSAVPVTTVDTVGTTIYFTPFKHSQIVLYDGATWNVYRSSEIAFSPSMTLNSTYDVFAYYDPTTAAVRLELSSAWTNDTTRNDPVSRVDGVLVKTGSPTRRLVGTIRTDSNARFIDSVQLRFVWNAQNGVDRYLLVQEPTASWTYATAAFRPARGLASNAFEYVTGDVAALDAYVQCLYIGASQGFVCSVGIGIDSTTVNSAQILGKTTMGSGLGDDFTNAHYNGYTVAGHHTITWLEYVGASATFYSTNVSGTTVWAISGIRGRIVG
jgi:hypothetical protein